MSGVRFALVEMDVLSRELFDMYEDENEFLLKEPFSYDFDELFQDLEGSVYLADLVNSTALVVVKIYADSRSI